jgi:hypothetical protein
MMNDETLRRAEAMRAAVREQIPEAVPVIRDLHQAGLIAGWRNVSYVGPLRERRGIPADVYLENSEGQYHGTAAEAV